jgi:hypothetical protein
MPCPCTKNGRIEMGFIDISIMAAIIAGALCVLYHSLWKKKGYCAGCCSGTCKIKEDPNSKGC